MGRIICLRRAGEIADRLRISVTSANHWISVLNIYHRHLITTCKYSTGDPMAISGFHGTYLDSPIDINICIIKKNEFSKIPKPNIFF